uniref:Pan3 pseudokinase domain-containing protein n=1 Tax=Parascaris equorum TaxID=6256 RepID=A0A914RIV7_PAREQ
MPMIGARFYAQLELAQMKNDLLENELSKELENGRLFRLLCKLNTIIERPHITESVRIAIDDALIRRCSCVSLNLFVSFHVARCFMDFYGELPQNFHFSA